MANSNLVTVTDLSPHYTANRNHAIDTITIHCVAAQCSATRLGEVFHEKRASANYGVGCDGSIGLYVDEGDVSWCSSNADNDNRAVTIEVASDNTHPYAVTDAAYTALIALVADICQRNGIAKLVCSTDKATRVDHLNGCNMTVHRDYANKACPGDWLYERHGEIAEAVNGQLAQKELTVPEAVKIVQNATGFADATMQFLLAYRYGDVLVRKLAEVIK